MSVIPPPSGSAGAAHFAGERSLAARRRADALRARADPEGARLAQAARTPPPLPPIPPARHGGWPRPPACVTARMIGGAPFAGAGWDAGDLRPGGAGSAEGGRDAVEGAAGKSGAAGAGLASASAETRRLPSGAHPSQAHPSQIRGSLADGAERDRPERFGSGGRGGADGAAPAGGAALGDGAALVPHGALAAAAGLVIVRQRPGSAKGVLFITLEDETGVVNVVVWSKVYERYRRAVLAGRLLRVTGRVQREGAVAHLVAERIEDVSHLLDALAEGRVGARDDVGAANLAPADEVRRPQPEGSRPPVGGAAARAQGLVRGAAPRAMHPRDQSKLLFRETPGLPPPES